MSKEFYPSQIAFNGSDCQVIGCSNLNFLATADQMTTIAALHAAAAHSSTYVANRPSHPPGQSTHGLFAFNPVGANRSPQIS